MRNTLSDQLVMAGGTIEKFLVITGDHGYSLFDDFRRAFPEKFINVGVAEQGLIGYAAGLAKTGFRPLVYGLASFIPIRVLEFIKMDICYEQLPVILLGDGAGLVYSTLGSSHQCGEDIGVLRMLPGMNIYSPADKFEMEFCFQRALKRVQGPSYIRIGKSDKPEVHSHSLSTDASYFEVVRNNSDVLLIATGALVSTARDIADEFHLDCISVPCITEFEDLDAGKIINGMKLVVTLEEHSVICGLGSIVSEKMVSQNINARLLRFGLQKKFTEKAGSYETALEEHGLSLSQLREAMKNELTKK